MLGRLPAAHVGADLGNDLQRAGGVDTVDVGQIHPRHALQGLIHAGRRPVAGVVAGIKAGQLRQDLPIAFGDLGLIELVELHRLLEAEQVLAAIMAVQRARDGRRGALAARVAQVRQRHRVALAAHNGADDAHPRHPADVGNHVGQLQVHLRKRFLHMLDVRRRIAHQVHPLAHIGAQRTHLLLGAKRPRQKPVAVQLLQPLTVEHVALSARHVLDVPRVDQPHLQPSALQDLEDRDPVNARGFHGHRAHATLKQPIGHAVQIVGEAGELPHHLLAAALRDSDKMAAAAHVDPGRTDIDVLQVLGQLRLPGSGSLVCSHRFGLRKGDRQGRTGSCRGRLSFKRDSLRFTSDEIASSRTMLPKTGVKAPMAVRPLQSGCRSLVGPVQVSWHLSGGSGFPAATIWAERLSHKKQTYGLIPGTPGVMARQN